MKKSVEKKGYVKFPQYTGIRCLMMPYIQGDPASVPEQYAAYRPLIGQLVMEPGKIGYLTIDESVATQGAPHRGARAKYGRALHTEAGRHPDQIQWGGSGSWGTWNGKTRVALRPDVRILLANSIDDTCAVWDATHQDTSLDGDIGDQAAQYPYENSILLKAGELCEIGIFTPHESLPVRQTCRRQFIRIVSSGVHGREEYFTQNPLVEAVERVGKRNAGSVLDGKTHKEFPNERKI